MFFLSHNLYNRPFSQEKRYGCKRYYWKGGVKLIRVASIVFFCVLCPYRPAFNVHSRNKVITLVTSFAFLCMFFVYRSKLL